MSDVTRILNSIGQKGGNVTEQLLPLVYEELKRLARAKMALEADGNTLQPTALVHEAYLRLVDPAGQKLWDGRGHFFAAAAEAMRRILIDHARGKKRLRKGGDRQRVELDDIRLSILIPIEELVEIDDAIQRLALEDPRAAEVVKLKYFAGLSIDDAASVLKISRATAYRHWTYARAWLRCELQGYHPGEALDDPI